MWPCWIYNLGCHAGDHQDHYIFRLGDPDKPSPATTNQRVSITKIQPTRPNKKEPWRAWQRHTETLSRTGYLELGDFSQFFQQMIFQAAFRPFWDIQIGHHRRTVIWKKLELVCFLVSKKPGNLANDRRVLLGKIVLFGDIWVKKKNSKSSPKTPTWFSVVFNHLVF